MRISIAESIKDPSGAIVAFVTKGGTLSASATDLDKRTGKAISRAIEASKFKGDEDQFLEIIGPAKIDAARLLLVGLGDPEKLKPLKVEEVGGAIVGRLKDAGPAAASIMVDEIDEWGVDGDEFAARLAYGALLKSYRFDKYFTSKGSDNKAPSLKRMAVVTEKAKDVRKAYRRLEKIAQGAFFTRDLVSEPANVLHPESFAEECRSLESLGVEVEVLGEKEMADLGMGSLLGVGQGSSRESQIVVMQWNGGGEKDKPVAFVGKGVTFDTGGISIKPASGMEMMKWDMGGAGAVCGLMKALAGRKAKANVVGVVGLVENMPSGDAQRPGDVVTSMSGQTIEVINTDAEGRLVLADALHYTQDRFKPQFVINLATLTGAIITSLGNEYAGLFSNNDELSEQLREAGDAEDEKVWRMPLGKAYDKMIKSGIADMKNVGTGGKAGSITAAQFLKRFIIKDTPWAHLDIAGVAWTDSEKPTVPKGGTGFGVRLLDRLVSDHYEFLRRSVTDISFYHLQRQPLENALPKLLERVVEAGMRAVVVADSDDRVDALNNRLWTYDPGSFLPHGSMRDGAAADQPIYLTTEEENPNQAGVLVLVDGRSPTTVGEYDRCLDMFDGNDPTAVEQARERWKAYQADGHSVTYWQQSDEGRWEKKG